KFNLPEADTIIIDPPRSGIPRNVIQKIIEIKPGKIINISCSTATLARDLSYFVDNGYKIEEMFLIDLFPHTAHLETMTLLKSQ
ncbi:MAG: 23S rRNA (uracil-5-)-methyltransferase RumA, partial [Candidatus Aminicenantes bacterium]|nr:23S rRNA (uracil-5-)-methyltransferase RumA [Candidatus Aminicenantes bacterium]